MRFTICHELDAPLDAVELALLSPELGPRLGRKVASLESVVTVEHAIEGGEMRRVLRFQASAPLPIFRGRELSREAMAWEETSTYRLTEHASTWSVAPLGFRGGGRRGEGGGAGEEPWRRYFRSEGTYRLEPLPGGRTRRCVEGSLEVRVPVLGPLVERMAMTEVRRTYDAEADTLRELSVL
ncbi:MAG TPA: DUF2505 family protein [Candidatus Nanopelagicales bacterium]|nr:DUF2505 family protein [Candidatus Nanopelagicales bacterium]